MKTIVISGISSGIGHALACHLSAQYQVIGCSRRRPDFSVLPSAQQERIQWIACDLTLAEERLSLIEHVQTLLGQEKIFAIIHNAGRGMYGAFVDEHYSIADYEAIMEVNAVAPIVLTKWLVHALDDDAKIIALGSYAGKRLMSDASVYQASKFALRGWMGALQKDWEHEICLIGRQGQREWEKDIKEKKWQRYYLINPKIVLTDFHDDDARARRRAEQYGETTVDDIVGVVDVILIGWGERWEYDL